MHIPNRAENALWRVVRSLGVFLPVCLLVVLVAFRDARASVNGSLSTGNIIYTAPPGANYRYGPSILLDTAGMHVYTCSPGSNGAWDYIRYMTSTNGGVTFGADSIVLQPTPGSLDAFSTCDPGVVEFGGYYYIAYTSTTNAKGLQNNVFVARSNSPTGPFAKWNGSGWGGNPAPFITYTGSPDTYGAGEPSLVVVGTTLYIYYTWADLAPDTSQLLQTRVATASTTNANWPGSITNHGVAIIKRADQMQDSSDVKYVDAYAKFIAVNTARRFGAKAYIQMWESTDGFTFSPSNLNPDNLLPYLHNDGISGDASGHIDVSQSQYIGYAYGPIWANWNTYLNSLVLSNDALPGKVDIYSVEPRNGAIRLEFQSNSAATSYTVRYGTQSGTYTSSVTGIIASPYTLTGLSNGTSYFIAINAVNASGSGAASSQVSAKPQNYQLITQSNAVASSQLSGWSATNVIDGNFSTNYSSNGHTSANSTEWIYLDSGANSAIGRLVIGDRQREQVAAPTLDGNLDTQIQVSVDASTWFNVDYRLQVYPIIDDDGWAKTVIDFNQPMYGRYVRLYSTKLNSDQFSNYYLQLGEIQAYSVPLTAVASSSLAGWPASSIIDNNPTSNYSSVSTDTTPWVGINLGSVQTIYGVNLTPRAAGYCFPVGFMLQSSNDGATWSTIPGQSYSNYPNPGSTAQSFRFSSALQAQYIRVYATQLGTDNNGSKYLQMEQMTVQQNIPFTATASSQTGGDTPSLVADNNSVTFWSSTGHGAANSTEWIELDMGSNYRVRDLRLVPRDSYCFPSSFAITYSTDNVNWFPVPGQQYTSFANPASFGTTPNPVQLMFFSTPVNARYFRITATQLTTDSFGNYYFQLADVLIDQ
jgi:hypothetical protein